MNNPNTVIESIFNNSVIARFYNMSLRAIAWQSTINKVKFKNKILLILDYLASGRCPL